MALRSLNVDVNLDASKLESGLKRAADLVADWAGGVGGTIAKAGVGFTMLGAGVAAGLAGAVKQASEFESSMAKISSLTNAAQADVQKWGAGLLDMAGKVGKAPKELADALYYVASAGQTGASALQIVEQSAKASATGLGKTEDIARAVTAAMNAYGAENLTAAAATDMLTQMVIEGAGEAEDYAKSLGRVIPIASQLGVQLDEVGAFMATFTRLGVSAEEAATALRGTLNALAAPGKKASDTMAALGLSAAMLREKLATDGLVSVLDLLMKKTHGNVEVLDNIIPNIRALTGVLAVAGSQAGEYAKSLDNIHNSTGRTEAAFQTYKQTVGGMLAELKGSMAAAAVELGQSLLPALKELIPTLKTLAGFVIDIVKWFASLSETTRNVVAGFVLFGGPALIAVGLMVSAVGNLIPLVVSLGSAIVASSATLLPLTAALATFYGVYKAGSMAVKASGLDRFLGDIGDEERTRLEAGTKVQGFTAGLKPGSPEWVKKFGPLPTIKKTVEKPRKQVEDALSALLGLDPKTQKELERKAKFHLGFELDELVSKSVGSKSALLESTKLKGGPIGAMMTTLAQTVDFSHLVMPQAMEPFKFDTGKFERDIAKAAQTMRDAGKPAKDIGLALMGMGASAEEAQRAIEGTVKETFNWESALQGVTLLASAIGGNFGHALQVISNITQQFKGWSDFSKQQKFAAVASSVGQIGGLVGGKAGGAMQGAAGGAMTGAAVGSVIPGLGTVAGGVIGGVVGAIGGWIGAGKKKKEEQKKAAEEMKAQFDELVRGLKESYGSIQQARTAARAYGIDLKVALDTKQPKALAEALDDLAKKQQGMATAMQAASGLANWKASSPEGAMAQGALFGSVFWAAVKTQGLTAAADALGDPFMKMFENASAQVQAFLAPIKQQLDLAKNEAFAGAAAGAQDLANLVTGLSEAGMISITDMQNASTVAMDQYNQALAAAQEQGLAGTAAQEAAIRAVGPAVVALIQLYADMGIPLDANLQSLKEQAEASGMIFPEDPLIRAAQAMEAVALALEKAFGFSTGLAANIDRIGAASVTIDTGSGRPDESFASGTRGPRIVKRDMLARIHAGEGLMVVPKKDMPRGGMGWGSFAKGAWDEDSGGSGGPSGGGGGGGWIPSGGTTMPTDAIATVTTAAASVEQAVQEVRQAAATIAQTTPILVQNTPQITLVDQSIVKTAEGQRAFRDYVSVEMDRILDSNQRGLKTKIEQIARRAVR